MANVAISGDTSGAVTLTVPAVAGTRTVTFPAATGTAMVSGNMPAFNANLSSQSIPAAAYTKITFGTVNYDTNSNFSSSRFTPTVAGYYLLVSTIAFNFASTTESSLYFYKNGSYFQTGADTAATTYSFNGSSIMYMNGSTDYAEVYGYSGNGGALNINTFFSGVLLRAA